MDKTYIEIDFTNKIKKYDNIKQILEYIYFKFKNELYTKENSLIIKNILNEKIYEYLYNNGFTQIEMDYEILSGGNGQLNICPCDIPSALVFYDLCKDACLCKKDVIYYETEIGLFFKNKNSGLVELI